MPNEKKESKKENTSNTKSKNGANSKKPVKNSSREENAKRTNQVIKFSALVTIVICVGIIISGIVYGRIKQNQIKVESKGIQEETLTDSSVNQGTEGEVKGENVEEFKPFKPPYINLPPETSAKAFAVLNVNEDIKMYSKNPDLALPPASLTKLMTAVVALEEYELDREVVIPANCTLVDGAKAGFKPYDVFTLQDVIYGLLVQSGADAACAIANIEGNPIEFIEKMNRKANEMGMENTEFQNEVGFDSEISQFSSVNDIVKLSRYALQYDTINKIVGTKEVTLKSLNSGNSYLLKNTNDLLFKIPGTIGIKTGTTEEAGQCLSYLYENPSKKEKIMIVILGSQDRFADTQQLLDWARNEIFLVNEKYPEL